LADGRRARRAFLAAAVALLALPARADEAAAWAALRQGGHVALIRHEATEPGIGDPPGYRLEDCGTQRNLSAQGRENARRLGERLRAGGVTVEKVFTSPWCRCRDTAMLAFGRADDWDALSSFFDDRAREPKLTERVKNRIGTYSTRKPAGTVVMVTHNVNILALTRESVGQGEIVVVRPDGCCGLKVVGRIALQ
jgi:phosphohistidine phosphatase SixA